MTSKPEPASPAPGTAHAQEEAAPPLAQKVKTDQTPRAIIYLWCLIPLGLLGGVLTLGMMFWIYSSVQTANLDADRFDEELADRMEAISTTEQLVEADFRHLLDRNDEYSTDSDLIDQLAKQAERQHELGIQLEATSDLGHLATSGLQDLRKRCLAWREADHRIHRARSRAWELTKLAISDLRAQLDTEEGRRRLHSILIAKQLTEQGNEEIDASVREFLRDSRSGSLLSMSKTELSDLEIVCNHLVSESEIELLRSIRENELKPNLDRLSRLISDFDNPELTERFQAIEDSLFEPEDPHAPGLYDATANWLESIRQQRELAHESDELLKKMDESIADHARAASRLRDQVATVAASSLRTGAVTVFIFGGLLGIVFGLLTYKVTHSVQRFVKELHRSHDALRQANEDLQASIKERDRLQIQLVEAQKLESIGQLAAGIAHEINTPAQYVGDNTRFLQTEFENIMEVLDSYTKHFNADVTDGSSEKQRNSIRDMIEKTDFEFIREEVPQAITQSLEGIERITKIVRAMKDFSHPGSDTQEPADLNTAIQSTSVVCSSRWKFAADLELDLDPNLHSIPCFLAEFNQVILNLIVNAADAIEAHRGESREKGWIRISTKQLENSVEIRVADNGGGMPDSVRAKIFDPFFTTKEVGKGTGQGLAISRDVIVVKHAGTLVCETEDGVGTTFIIGLPLDGKAEQKDRAASKAA